MGLVDLDRFALYGVSPRTGRRFTRETPRPALLPGTP